MNYATQPSYKGLGFADMDWAPGYIDPVTGESKVTTGRYVFTDPGIVKGSATGPTGPTGNVPPEPAKAGFPWWALLLLIGVYQATKG